MCTFIGMPLGSLGFKTRLYLTLLGSRLGSARGSVRLGSALHDTTLFGARLGLSWLGSGLGPKLGSTRLSLGSGAGALLRRLGWFKKRC